MRHRADVAPLAGPPPRGHLPFADAPAAPDPIEVTSRWLTRGGRPWFPVSGEFHYSRYPAREWEEELLKMKAGGITVVASYVIWIHHEETEGRVRFDGDRDLRRFARLCARHGLDFVPRIGPWSHAEVRNGGLPDWVLARTTAPRTDDPAYLTAVRPWWEAIASQLDGLDRAHDGPVVAIQIENELYDQPGHLRTLKRMAQETGLRAPLWTSTAWGGVHLPDDELLPLYGGYSEAFWTEADGGWPDTCRKHFFFTHQRDDEGIGADLRPTTVRGTDPDAYADRFPWATCELGGGMAVAYHRRPRVDAADIGALGLTKIGCGSVWQGYYMFHGGTNPTGERTPLQESHATAYPNDLPVLTYDFQAPLGEYGQYRPSYDELRLQHLLLADFGELIAPMRSVLPDGRPRDQHDRDTLRWAVRGDGRASGFLFVTNHQPHEPLPDHPDTSFTIGFPGAPPLSLPSTPVTVPAGAYFCWPLRLDVAGLRLDWATAQPVCTVADDGGDGGGRTVLVLAATDGIEPELALDATTVTSVVAPSGADVTTVADGDRVLITGLRPGTDALVETETPTGDRVALLVLDAATARTAYRGEAWGAQRLVLCADGVVFDATTGEVRIHPRASDDSADRTERAERAEGAGRTDRAERADTACTAGSAGSADEGGARDEGAAGHSGDEGSRDPAAAVSLSVLPAPDRPPTAAGAGVKESQDGALTRYTLVPDEDAPTVAAPTLAALRPAGPPPAPETGVLGRASAPADEHYDTRAAVFRVDVPASRAATPPLPGSDLLRLHWTGDVARAYVGDTLVADQFFTGRPWDIALDRLPPGEPLTLRILPLAAGAAVHLPVTPPAGIAEVRHAERITTRTWRLGTT
ncbi:beta-galactosidase [Streptomyces rishiriensis]|uniref:Beta-galactosidase n=1 Tax=Streptomyces rishiriensis TaxID=68264 RepID=A0ABU0NWJ6_STRRH|nr:beta-galactosidase [Streptomyces rishiriensis]MDQ0583474.1 beta-galactosidase [Streptomyces rishiriensis]